MKKVITLIGLVCVMLVGNSWAMDHSKMEKKDSGGMQHGDMKEMKTFKEMVMVDGIHAEFQVMELASMNMSDPQGNTHHVMASFMKNNEKITQMVGKIKLISPSGKEQIATLKDFGSGMFAANFIIDEKGKWGVICLFKDEGGKHTAKFWYPHDAA